MKIWPSFARSRQIFHYHDGRKKRSIDPQQAWLDIWQDTTVCDPEMDIPLCQGDKLDVEAQVRVIDMACRVFGVQRYNEKTGGLVMSEIFELLALYFIYMDTLKKKRAPLPIRSPPTDLESSADESTTQPEPASCSTPSE